MAHQDVLRYGQVDILADRGTVFLGGDVGPDHMQGCAGRQLDAAVQGADAGDQLRLHLLCAFRGGVRLVIASTKVAL